MPDDPFNLRRFVEAQEFVFEEAREELRRGAKQGHWMWFIFPQLRGLGRSSVSQQYGIASLAEAEAFLAHTVLGPRLIECTQIVNGVDGRSAKQIFGSIDTLKFRSSMTLFAQVAGEGSVFADALNKYFEGQPDRLTLSRLAAK